MAELVATFRIEHTGDTLILTPQRDALDARYESFHHEYNELQRMISEKGIANLVVDFAQISFFSSTLLGAVIELARRVKRQDGSAVLCGLNDNLQEVFSNMMLLEKNIDENFFSTFASRDEALQALAS